MRAFLSSSRLMFTASVSGIVCIASLSGCVSNIFNGNSLIGSGTIITEKRAIGSFYGIINETSCDIVITCKGAPSLSITADDNIITAVRTEVVNGVLRISSNTWSLSPKRLEIAASTDSLQSIDLQGSGNLNATAIEVQTFSTRLSGSGNVSVQGTTASGNYVLSGSGSIEAQQLTARKVVANVSGSGSIRAWAAESIAGTISGSGEILYYGNPGTVNRSLTGSGSMRSGQ